jgi:hypothetical protein
VKESLRAGDLVSGNALATHLGCTRQNVARLTAEGIIERRPDGRYNQDHARLKYIAHLRSERRGSARAAADIEFASAKAQLIRLRIAEKQRDLIPMSEATDVIEAAVGRRHADGLVGDGRALRRSRSAVAAEDRAGCFRNQDRDRQRGEPAGGRTRRAGGAGSVTMQERMERLRSEKQWLLKRHSFWIIIH